MLKCCLINARSLVNINKRDELELYMRLYDLDIVGVTESWMTAQMQDSEVQIGGFTLYRKDRGEIRDSRGGGVLLFVKDSIDSAINEDLSELSCESLWIKIYMDKNYSINLGICYRSESATAAEIDCMYQAITAASQGQALIMGDFNYRTINWTTLEADSHEKPFINLIQDCFLTQHVLQPTRGKNILDLILTTDPNTIEEVEVLEHFSTSDHQIVMWSFLCTDDLVHRDLETYCWYRADYVKLRKELCNNDWTALENKSVCEMWDLFVEILNDAIERNVGYRRSQE